MTQLQNWHFLICPVFAYQFSTTTRCPHLSLHSTTENKEANSTQGWINRNSKLVKSKIILLEFMINKSWNSKTFCSTLAVHYPRSTETSFPSLQHLSLAHCHSSAGAAARIPVWSSSKRTEKLHWVLEKIG